VIAWLVRDWPLKVASIAAAALLWWFVVTTERARFVLPAPVEYVGLVSDRLLVGPRLDSVDVEVEAVRWVASRIAATGLRARVNLAGLPDGESLVSVSPTDVDTPAGVSVTRITPARTRVSIVKAVKRTVRVKPNVRGTPARGFVVGPARAEPETVQIEGPRSTIESSDAIPTAPVDVTGKRETIVSTIPLAIPEGVSSPRERTVRVTVEIRAEAEMQQRKPRR
jgi:hypothetical protein